MTMLFLFLIFSAIIIFLLATTIYAAIIAAPFVATPKEHIRKAFQICHLKPGEKFYDLGSGSGRALIIASQEFGAQAQGLELSYPLYLISRINIRLRGLSKQTKVKWSNFYNEDLSRADVIFCWLTPKAFQKLNLKFNRELKTGARVITFSSALGFWQPEQEIEVPLKGVKLFGKSLITPSRVKLFLYSKR